MHRYFLEVSYKGTAYKGFQKQPNDITIQSEVEKALHDSVTAKYRTYRLFPH